MKWIDAKKELPKQEKIDDLNMSISPYVLIIAQSMYDADMCIPQVSRLVNGKWEFGFMVEDDVAYWSPLPSLEEIAEQIKEQSE